MGQELAVIDRAHDGPMLRKLSDQQRVFVMNMVEMGAKPKVCMRAAKQAGYHAFYGYELMRDTRILDAIHEEAGKKLVAGALVGVKVMIEIAQDKDHKDRYKAAKDLAAINGFSPEQKIRVEHVTPDSKEIVKEIRKLAHELNIDADAWIKATGFIEDGEFTEVQNGG